jgi:hypothetical protein
MVEPREPKEFGDDWSEELSVEDRAKAAHYFQAVDGLARYLDFIALRCGGKDHVIELAKSRFQRGITFAAPRNSLMTSIEYEIFDDMLIGNFMKTILHGKFRTAPLYPYVGEYLTKYADNGRARSREEVREYLGQYFRRAPLAYLRHRLERTAVESIRFRLRQDSLPYRIGAGAYHRIRHPRLLINDLGLAK